MQKEDVLKYVDDLVSCFVYYDRKECEELPVGKLEELIKDGVISIDDITERFRIVFIEAIHGL